MGDDRFDSHWEAIQYRLMFTKQQVHQRRWVYIISQNGRNGICVGANGCYVVKLNGSLMIVVSTSLINRYMRSMGSSHRTSAKAGNERRKKYEQLIAMWA